MGNGRVRPSRYNYSGEKVKPSNPNQEQNLEISFNWKHLKNNPEKFNYAEICDKQYFLKLLERLREVSKIKKVNLIQEYGKAMRCHRIGFLRDGRLSEETFGYSPDCDDEAYQFSISEREHGRVAGYFILNVFYVVWLDKNHELSPWDGK